MILVALALVAARLLDPPPLISNDSSRWATVDALAEDGRFAIGQRVTAADGSWHDEMRVDSIDRILDPHSGAFYSSAPPWLPLLLAGAQRPLGAVTGWHNALADARLRRVLLFTFNWLPLAVFLIAMARAGERLATTAFARLYLVAAVCFGTFVLAFAPVLNNHVQAAFGCGIALWALVRLEATGREARRLYLVAGVAAGWAASHDIPALCLPLALGAILLFRSPRLTLRIFTPAALLPLAGFWLANAASFGDPLFFYTLGLPPRGWFDYPGSYWLTPTGIDIPERSAARYVLHFLVGHHGVFSLTPLLVLVIAAIPQALTGGSWWTATWRGALGLAAFTGAAIGVGHFARLADWPLALDVGPFALLSVAALCLPIEWWRRPRRTPEFLARLSLACSLPTLTFYFFRTANYGGSTAGPRYVLWLAPLWLLTSAPALDAVAATLTGRLTALLLLAVSMFSVGYGLDMPWRAPWLVGLFTPG